MAVLKRNVNYFFFIAMDVQPGRFILSLSFIIIMVIFFILFILNTCRNTFNILLIIPLSFFGLFVVVAVVVL